VGRSLISIVVIVALVLGYFLGAIPFGLVITKFGGATDPRTIGSHNIGATNVLRTGRKDLAAATLLFDALKGTVAVLIAGRWGESAGLAAALGAFLGHLFPVWLSFKGGKGVATFLGCLLGMYWPVALVFAVVWLGVAASLRYSSAAALGASVVSTASLFAFGLHPAGALFIVLTTLLFLKHRENISRLKAGTESKIGGKS
jgi:glycerol-3-phosphate acyltransferase PlsY